MSEVSDYWKPRVEKLEEERSRQAAEHQRLTTRVEELEAKDALRESQWWEQIKRYQGELAAARARIAELEAAAKAPLPEEVAGLVERATAAASVPCNECRDGELLPPLCAALERMAREIERLRERQRLFDRALTTIAEKDKLIEELASDIRALETIVGERS
jgi:hypothetical protein